MNQKLILLSTAIAAIPQALEARGVSQPNILIFISDDHGFEQSAPYGCRQTETPNMAQLAEEGLVFDRAYVASPASGPSRAALLSGLYPARNGAIANHQVPRAETQTMVRRLQDQGYEVVAIGKVAHNYEHPKQCGFDHCDLEPQLEDLIERTREYLESHRSTKPLCLIVGDRRPHVPWVEQSTYDPQKVRLPNYLIDTPSTREHWARYMSDITSMDRTLGVVNDLFTDYLKGEEFISIYTSDHGGQWPFGKWNLYERGVRVPLIIRWRGEIEAGERTDAMVSWVDIFPTLIELAGGERVEHIDGYSFADVLSDPKRVHREEIYTTHTSDGVMNVYPIRAVRDGEFKYIRNLHPDCYHSNHSDIQRRDGAGAYWDSWDEIAKSSPKAAAIIQRYYQRPAEELYNLKKDPFERKNLAENPKYRATLERMQTKLEDWCEAQGDTFPLPRKPYLLSGPVPYEIVVKK